MTLPPLSSLRSLVLLMSHGKPRLSSFSTCSSSVAAAAAVTPTPAAPAVQSQAAPAVQPPAATALPDCSSHKSPDHEELVLYAVNEDPKHPIPDYGSDSSTTEPECGLDKHGLNKKPSTRKPVTIPGIGP